MHLLAQQLGALRLKRPFQLYTKLLPPPWQNRRTSEVQVKLLKRRRVGESVFSGARTPILCELKKPQVSAKPGRNE